MIMFYKSLLNLRGLFLCSLLRFLSLLKAKACRPAPKRQALRKACAAGVNFRLYEKF